MKVRARVKRKTPESGVLRACLDLLAYEGVFHRRWNSGSSIVDNGDGTKRMFRYGSKGDADIFSLIELPSRCPECNQKWHHPMPLWIETKSETGRQSIYQKAFQQDVESRGHTYLLVRDVDTLRNWLKERGAI